MKRASLVARFFALVIDMAFLWCVSALVAFAVYTGHRIGSGRFPVGGTVAATGEQLIVFFVFSCALFFFYFTYLTAHGEKTIGKGVFGLKVVRRKDQGDLGWGRAFARAFCYGLSAFPFFLGFFAALLLGGRSLHDILAGTEVIREE